MEDTHKEEPHLEIPARMIPSYVVGEAYRKKSYNNFLIHAWGGLGDQVCAEPAIRYAIENFKKPKISIITKNPELYTHLGMTVYNSNTCTTADIDPSQYIRFETVQHPSHLIWEYASHMLCHAVDYPAITMWRMMLPNKYKQIKLPDYLPESKELRTFISECDTYRVKERIVVIHAGRHWPSKTFPKLWWDSLLTEFLREGFKPVLVGKHTDNAGYVNVNKLGCFDFRDQLSIKDLVFLLKWTPFVFSNDSSPIHIAASGNAFIGFVSTVKHPDFLCHWRQGQFSYKMKNFGLDGPWNHLDYSPVQFYDLKIDELPIGLMDKILPQPVDVVQYYCKII